LASIDSLATDHFDKTFNLNTRAPVFLVQKLLPLMTGDGSMILVSSAMHVIGIPGRTAYAATVIGAASGLGLATSKRFAAERARPS
jgi:NAD(P)-dependent dehydrogenase (short-subunit alcohol dehydrogenase family)